MEEGHHVPPASFMALSKARLLSVRRSPLLRGRSVMPVSMRRRSMRAVNSATGMALFGLAFEVCDAIIASAFISYPFVHIVQIGLIMKDEQRRACSRMAGVEPEAY